MTHPVDSVYQDSVQPAKADVRALWRDRAIVVMASEAEVASTDLAGQDFILIGGAIWYLDAADVTSPAAAGVVAVSNDGARFKPQGQTLNTFRFSLADDAVQSITIPGDAGYLAIADVEAGTPDATARAFAHFICGTTPAIVSVDIGSNTTVATGAHTGTTGSDGDLTIAPQNDGTIQIENRRGSQRTFAVTIFCGVQ